MTTNDYDERIPSKLWIDIQTVMNRYAIVENRMETVEHAKESKEYAKLISLKGMSPSEVQAWVDSNINTLADVKDALKTLAIAASILARRI